MELVYVAVYAAMVLCVICAVVCTWQTRQNLSSSTKSDVDDLISTVDRFTRQARREQMRRVRGAAPPVASDGDGGAPPELAVVHQDAIRMTKHDLRRRLMGGHR